MNSFRINRNLVAFTVFLSAMSFAVHIAAPFFVVYMLSDLGISYPWYAVIVSFGALVTIVSQPHWGRLSDTFGERRILVITGLLVCFVPFLYLFIRSPVEVLLVEGFSGFVWAGFELAGFNFMLAVTPAEKRPTYVANHSFFKGIAIVLGTFAGGMLAEHFKHANVAWLFGLQILFLISFVLRLASLVLLAKVKEAEPREDFAPIRYVFWHAVGIEPAKGLAHDIAYTFRYPYELRKLKDKMLRDVEEMERRIKRKAEQAAEGISGRGGT